jgi:NAD(P)-dependent dehydrogenase (short-subunit alcohol dehydrogenase family)
MSLTRLLASVGDKILDPSIVFSFDRTGYNRHKQSFISTDLDVDMTGRVCAVTGANSGLGKATAKAFAQRGAEVWMLCRNQARAEKARDELVTETGNKHIHVSIVDVGDLESVHSFVQDWPVTTLDVLVHNAGVLPNQRTDSPQGIETTLSINLVGPLALTAGVTDRLKAGKKPRIIWVSSGGMYSQTLRLDHLEDPPGSFDGVKAYARTKRAMVMASERLADELKHTGIAVHCMHPGWANTKGVRDSIPGFWKVTRMILRSPEEGADTIVWLGVNDRAQDQTGLFWFDRKPRSAHLLPGTQSTQATRDEVWLRIHELAGISPHQWAKPNPQEMS